VKVLIWLSVSQRQLPIKSDYTKLDRNISLIASEHIINFVRTIGTIGSIMVKKNQIFCHNVKYYYKLPA
jgi:pyrimidine operon attenuation protein/uracil phosphoribosyltransferase